MLYGNIMSTTERVIKVGVLVVMLFGSSCVKNDDGEELLESVKNVVTSNAEYEISWQNYRYCNDDYYYVMMLSYVGSFGEYLQRISSDNAVFWNRFEPVNGAVYTFYVPFSEIFENAGIEKSFLSSESRRSWIDRNTNERLTVGFQDGVVCVSFVKMK